MDRRTFLSATPGVAAGIALGTSQRVEAEATVFFAQPDGRSVLTRFTAHGLDAPAARLRVFGQNRRLLGTAGLLRTGNALYGELWLALDRETAVTSELEAPGLRGVHRTSHRLRIAPRWTIHWLRIRDADGVAAELETLPVIRDAVHAGLLRAGGVTLNPLARAGQLLDHLEFLRQPEAARSIARRFGIPMAPIGALRDAHAAWPTLPLVLAGHGLRVVLTGFDGGPPFRWWEAPDGSRTLLAAVAPEASSRALEFGASVGAMTGRVSRWIEGLAGRTAPSNFPHVVVLDLDADDGAAQKLANVSEWNRRFAFPRLIVGPSPALEAWENLAVASTPVAFHPTPDAAAPREGTTLRVEADGLQAARTRRAAGLVELARQTLGAPAGAQPQEILTALAANVDAAYPGALVFNPTPFRRTDTVLMPSGVRHVVTDVPALGYAFVPEAVWRDAPEPRRPPSGNGVTTPNLSLEIDERHGAIRSLRTGDFEWARHDADGLNAVAGAILEDLDAQDVDGIGTRLILKRWSPARGTVRTAVTVYDALPFVDIENEAEAVGGRPMEYYFHWWAGEPAVAWDVPAGWMERTGTIPHLALLQWIRVATADRHVGFASPDAHHAAFLPPGALTSFAPPGRARYRLWPVSVPAPLETAWRAGYTAEPLVAVRSTGGGSRLPRYGSLIRVQPEGVLPIGWVPEGRGALLYLLNGTADDQYASVSHGALRFETARLADLSGQDRGDVAGQLGDGVIVQVPRRGVVVVRLDGVGLNA